MRRARRDLTEREEEQVLHLAGSIFAERWGRPVNDADRVHLDITGMQDAWEQCRRERGEVGTPGHHGIEDVARRKLSDVKEALDEAVMYAAGLKLPAWPIANEAGHSLGDPAPVPLPTVALDRSRVGSLSRLPILGAGQPTGHAAQILIQCVPAILRALDAIEEIEAAGIDVNAAVEPTRSWWLRYRVEPIYYASLQDMLAAPPRELAVLGILSGWRPTVPERPGHHEATTVLDAEAELQRKARAAVAKSAAYAEEQLGKFVAMMRGG
jgi:hypothetical protein